MAHPLHEWAHRARYTAKMGWYAAHYAAARRRSGGTRDARESPSQPDGEGQKRAALVRAAMRELIDRDWKNIEQGVYDAPLDLEKPLPELLQASRLFFRDLPEVDRRRRQGGHSEVPVQQKNDIYPRYYMQNFHYQTDGYLSETSAALYDFQVETLFSGTADVMRRQALVPLREAVRGRDQRKLKLLDVACGTGSFLAAVKHNYPRLPVTALDLSPDYLDVARRDLSRWRDVEFLRANAERIPAGDESFDIVTCIYLFHELPPKVRETVIGEIARLLKPGGALIFVDSLQMGDMPELDRMLEQFPERFHEPYYGSYIKQDLAELFSGAGLTVADETLAFLSKVVVAEKPAQVTADI